MCFCTWDINPRLKILFSNCMYFSSFGTLVIISFFKTHLDLIVKIFLEFKGCHENNLRTKVQEHVKFSDRRKKTKNLYITQILWVLFGRRFFFFF